MTGWFCALGEPLNAGEQATLLSYLTALGAGAPTIRAVQSWNEARALINRPDWQASLWQAEQAERARLLVQTPNKVSAFEALSATLHGAAAVAATRMGCSDAGLIRAAAGAATEAAYLAELALKAGAANEHPFLRRQALFEGGHWPLVLIDNHYYIF